MPSALAVDWDQIKQSAIAGVPLPDIAKAWGMLDRETGKPDTTAIRKRSSREQWPVPAAIMERAQKKMAQAKAQIAALAASGIVSQTGVTLVTLPPKPLEMASQSLCDTHAQTAMQLVQASAAALGAFAAQPAPVTDWQEAATAYKVQRLAAGIDKEGAQVRVNVAMFTESGAPMVRAEEPDSWDCEPAVSETVTISSQALDTEGAE